MSDLLYSTDLGKFYLGKCEDTIRELDLKRKVQLILTSPPFPLNNKKQYGNLNGEEYLKWFTDLAELFSGVLAPNVQAKVEPQMDDYINIDVVLHNITALKCDLYYKRCKRSLRLPIWISCWLRRVSTFLICRIAWNVMV